jgi:uncharacterized membrane protein YedE/YeeE
VKTDREYSVVYNIAERSGYVSLTPRSNSPLGLLAKYDGNIIGGALLGAGMGLSGACPGTLLTQVAVGVSAGYYALLGAVIGGIAWTGFLSGAVKRRGLKGSPSTFDKELGLSRAAATVLFEALCAGVVITTTAYASPAPEPETLGFVGGLLIGGAQLFSILTRRSMLGVSTSYEEAGDWFWWILKGGGGIAPGYKNIFFASGLVGGAYTLARLVPNLVEAPVMEVSPLFATVGGAIMVIGSRLAGGCTSGHGISGMSLLSTSSIVTIASTFAAGIVVASVVH